MRPATTSSVAYGPRLPLRLGMDASPGVEAWRARLKQEAGDPEELSLDDAEEMDPEQLKRIIRTLLVEMDALREELRSIRGDDEEDRPHSYGELERRAEDRKRRGMGMDAATSNFAARFPNSSRIKVA